jgi:DNA-binding beta-propeller fold protein YncE
MQFLPAVLIPYINRHRAFGGIAVNLDGTLLASVDDNCLHIFVVGSARPAIEHTALKDPRSVCFVRRNGVDTILVCDTGANRVVEISSDGSFLRAIPVPLYSFPNGIAYCNKNDVIAVSLFNFSTVILLRFDCGTIQPEFSIAHGDLYFPKGVAFTEDGLHLIVADWGNHRVCKFSASTGAFVALVGTGIYWPQDVAACNDGTVVVAQGDRTGVILVVSDGMPTSFIYLSDPKGPFFLPYSLSYCSLTNDVVVKGRGPAPGCGGGGFLLRDSWCVSSRCAWLSAVCTF